jgi:hypothetical protein
MKLAMHASFLEQTTLLCQAGSLRSTQSARDSARDFVLLLYLLVEAAKIKYDQRRHLHPSIKRNICQ